MTRVRKTVEEKKANRKAWFKKRGEWIRNELTESIDNHDWERFDKAFKLNLSCDYIPIKEARMLYGKYIKTWAKVDIENSPHADALKEIIRNCSGNI